MLKTTYFKFLFDCTLNINLCIVLNLVEFLQKQLKNLKDALKKCLDKRKQMTRSGAAASSLPKCKFFDQMTFLHEKSENLPTESNININPPREEQDPFRSPPPSPAISVTDIAREKTVRSHSKSKARNLDDTETMLLKQLQHVDREIETAMQSPRIETEEELFCRSLIPVLSGLPVRKKRMAKIKISQLLYEIEFDETCD